MKATNVLLLFICGALACAAVARPAAAALCLKRSGVVVFRTDGCKHRESPVGAEQVCSPGPKGDRGPQGIPAGLVLRNSAGREIGLLGIASVYAAIRSPLDGQVITVRAFADGFSGDVTLYHEAANCAGQALYPLVADTLEQDAGFHDGKLYYGGEPIMNHTMQSQEESSTRPCPPGTATVLGLCCSPLQPALGPIVAGPVKILDASLFGTPPFRADLP